LLLLLLLLKKKKKKKKIKFTGGRQRSDVAVQSYDLRDENKKKSKINPVFSTWMDNAAS